MAYLSDVLGIALPCCRRNFSSVGWSLFPTSRSIQPTALCMRSSLSPRQQFGDAKCVGEFILPDKIMRCDDADAAFPQAV